MNRNKYLLSAPLGLLTVTVITGAFLSSNVANGTSASTATAAVKIAASCTLTSTGGGNYSATVPNGTSAEIPGSTLSVSCNDAGGFALYAVGYSNDTIGNNNMIGQSTNIATNTSGNDSYWAMKINPTTGTTPTIENSFNNYHIVPNAHTKVASYASSTGTGSLSVNATYKANISSTQLAGNYLGKVKYTLVHPSTEIMPHEIACDPGKICYNPNTATALGEMGKQSASNNDSITLYAPNFKRDGFGFAGWNTTYDYSGTNYGPNETITAPSDVSTNGLSLYAVWLPSAGSLQNWDGCSSLAQGATTALTDERDGNTYAVAKLADGKCWMIENLRLDNNPELTSANTHNPSLQLTNSWYYKNFRSTLTTSNHLSPTTDPYQTYWCNSPYSVCLDQSMLATNNTTLFISNVASSYNPKSNVYSYGNYYNWYSATAGYGKYDSGGDGYHAPGDICPARWHLPKGGNKTNETDNEFWSLIVIGLNSGTNPASYNSTEEPYYQGAEADKLDKALRKYPNNFILSGNTFEDYISSRHSTGSYWTASYSSIYESYQLIFYDTLVYPGTYSGSEYQGRSVRCVAGE